MSEYESFNTKLKALCVEHHLLGCAWTVLKNQDIVLDGAFGYANLASKRQVTTTTPFMIASVSKPIAAILVMMLVRENLISLDGTMREYHQSYDALCTRVQANALAHPEHQLLLGDYRCDAYDITLRQHLTHTAQGIPNNRFFYNGFLYGIPARAIRDVTGKSASDYLYERIVAPLELKNTTARVGDGLSWAIDDAIADLYHEGQQVEIASANFNRGFGAGIVTSIADMAQIDKALDSDDLLSSDERAQMWQASQLNDGTLSPYGIGWFVQATRYGELVWHSGWLPQAASALYLKIPEQNLTFMIFANSDGIWWGNQLDEGDVLPSAFAHLFLETFAD